MFLEFLRINSILSLLVVVVEVIFSESYFADGVLNGLGALVGDYLFIFVSLSGFVFIGIFIWYGRSGKKDENAG